MNIHGAMPFMRAHSALPPGFAGSEMIYVFSIFGLMTVALLSAEWLWRLVWTHIDERRSFYHPLTVQRLIMILLLVSVEMRVAPNVARMMLWTEVEPVTRMHLSFANRFLEGASVVPFLLAWFVALLCGPMIGWQLARQPIPLNLWPSYQQMKRPLLIGGLTLAIALGVTFAP